MCGIFGITATDREAFPPKQLQQCLKDLFLLSESRGKEASGLAAIDGSHIRVLKSAASASHMMKTRTYSDLVHNLTDPTAHHTTPFTAIGHSRLVTTGSQYDMDNNQPVIAGGITAVHNGIIVNSDELWSQTPTLSRQCDVDTEILLALIRQELTTGAEPAAATCSAFQKIEGVASVALLFEDLNILLLATNNGSLYRMDVPASTAHLFASERYILEQIATRPYLRRRADPSAILQLTAGDGCIIDLTNQRCHPFALDGSTRDAIAPRVTSRTTELLEGITDGRATSDIQRHVGLRGPASSQASDTIARLADRFRHDTTWQDSLRRCTRCLLPETMPFLEFDDHGVCSYCRHYRPIEHAPLAELEALCEPVRGRNGGPDCVIGVSGGRDSLYALHVAKNVLNMTPVAYTYDWGMVTDLARRNISRICATLGIEHIIVSADITRKRRFIRQNVQAWLKKPRLGMIPLFMAGDKLYYYYLQQIQRHTHAPLAFLGENMLERTDFKTGFANVRPFNSDAEHVYTLPLSSRIRLAAFYTGNYLSNASYINSSLIDTIKAYASYYLIRRDYINLYRYVEWKEETIVPLLLSDYGFELSPDSDTTWRIGDGTAAFYNYIYHTVAGFTENETFRSNQIREGHITREDALRRVREENKPRFESLYWYLNIIGMDRDVEDVLETIHKIPKLTAHGGRTN